MTSLINKLYYIYLSCDNVSKETLVKVARIDTRSELYDLFLSYSPSNSKSNFAIIS